MLDLAAVLALTLWAAFVGRTIAGRLASPTARTADALALAVPLGLGTLSLATLALGTLGWLNLAGLTAVLAVGGIVATGSLILSRPSDRSPDRVVERAVADPLPGDLTGPGLAFDLVLAGCLCGSLLMALTPVTDGDALCYHLQVPKVFLERSATAFEPDLHETVYPLVTEMLYAVALAYRGPVACRLIQWVLGLAFAAGVAALARPVLGRRARWAAAVALAAPAVSNGMGAPLNDVALAAFATSALLAWVRWLERPTHGGAALAGVMAGLAVGVKYPGLVWCGLLGLSMVAAAWSRYRERRDPGPEEPTGVVPLSHPLAFGLAMLLVGGGWYVRAYLATGNPVFPFFRDLFGSGLAEVLEPAKRPMRPTAVNLLTALAPLTLQPDRFDSLAHQFGPVFLLTLPGLLLLRPPRRVVGLVGFGYAFLALCLTQRQSMRFVLAALGPFSVGVAWSAAAWWRRGAAGRVLVGGLLLVLAAETGLALVRPRHAFGVVLGRESTGDYLTRREPTWVVGRWIDDHLPPSARLVGQDHRGYYIPRPYTMELAHRRRTGLATRGESPEQILGHLRDAGFTHLLLCPPSLEGSVEFDPTLGRRLAPWLAAHRPLFDRELADADGVVRRYAIFELGPARRTAALGGALR